MSVGQLERLKVWLPFGIVGISHDKLPRVACPGHLSLDIHSDAVSLLLWWDTVLEVDRERRGHPVLNIVDVILAYLLIKLDVVNRTRVAWLGIVERAGREGLHIQNLRRVV